MSSSPSTLPASTPTVLELGNRRSLEVSRTVPAGTRAETEASLRRTVHASAVTPASPAEPRFATGTSPPSSGLDAHLIAIGTPTPAPASHAAPATPPASPEPRTVFLGGSVFVPPSRSVTNAPRPSIALAIFWGVLALVIAPLAPIAWMHAAEQLDLIARGLRRPTGKRVLHAVQGIGIAMTVLAVAATAFGISVVIARALR